MAEVISLSKARKAKARTECAAEAAENRIRFGRTKAEKSAAAAQDEHHRRIVEGARRIAPADAPSAAAAPGQPTSD